MFKILVLYAQVTLAKIQRLESAYCFIHCLVFFSLALYLFDATHTRHLMAFLRCKFNIARLSLR